MTLIVRGKGIKIGLTALMMAFALTGCGGTSTSSSSSTSVSDTAQTTANTIALSSPSYSVAPGSSAIITIYRSGSTGTASANYSTVSGSARAGVDYTSAQGSLTWADGDSSARTIIVPISRSASGKSFAVALSGIQGAGFGDPSAASVEVTYTLATISGSSGGTGTSGSSTSSSGSSGGTTSATLSWSPPSENTNGSAITNLAGYNIYYGTSTSTMTNKISIDTVGVTDYVIQNIESGTWYFAMTAVNSAGVESVLSGTVRATL